MKRDEFSLVEKITEDAIKKERIRWIDKLYDLKIKMAKQHEEFYEMERYDDAYGLSVAIYMVDEVIKQELRGGSE